MRFFLSFLLVAAAAMGMCNACKTTLGGVTYDFTSLQATEYYTFSGGVARHDRVHRGHHGEKYVYYVNFCKDVDVRAMNETACNEKAVSPAYQVTKESRYHAPLCYSLGSNKQSSFGFIDEEDQSLGVRLAYVGGEECFKRVERLNSTGHTVVEWDKVTRAFHVDFVCEPEFGLEPSHFVNMAMDKGASVSELEQCVYTLKFHTHLACGGSAPKRAANLGQNSSPQPQQSRSFLGRLVWWLFALAVVYVAAVVLMDRRRAQIGLARVRTNLTLASVLAVADEVFSPKSVMKRISGGSKQKGGMETPDDGGDSL